MNFNMQQPTYQTQYTPPNIMLQNNNMMGREYSKQPMDARQNFGFMNGGNQQKAGDAFSFVSDAMAASKRK